MTFLRHFNSEDFKSCYSCSVSYVLMWHRRLLEVWWWWFHCREANHHNTSISEETVHCTGGPHS